VVLLHLYSVELDIALSPTFLHTNQLASQQRNSINAGLESIKSWFDIFFMTPPAAYIGFPFSILSQLVRCLVTLSRLITLDDLSWGENSVWKAVDVVLVFDRVINNLEQVAILAGLDNSDSPEGDPFSRAAPMFRALRHGLEAKLSPDDLSTVPLPQNINEMFPPDAFPVELFDDDWLMDVLLSPNY
jgi:hypothetical protein